LKQVQYGYNTAGYDKYLQEVPKKLRASYHVHPRTPDAYLLQSKRQWDGRVQKWRRDLHKWDPVGVNDASAVTSGASGVAASAIPAVAGDAPNEDLDAGEKEDEPADDDDEDVFAKRGKGSKASAGRKPSKSLGVKRKVSRGI
jgi:hypothetical protein